MEPANQPSNADKARVDQLMEEMDFDLREVTWGYQEIFREVIAELHGAGLLGEESQRVTEAFFALLKRSDKSGFDMVLKSYLDALRGPHRWIMRLPRLFERWTQMGLQLAQERYYLGARFFEYSGEGCLGESPKELEFVLDLIAQLQEEKADLIPALMEGFQYLNENLHEQAIREYIGHALTLHGRSEESASKFLAGELNTSEVYVERLSRQANLHERKGSLERLSRALCGYEVTVDDIGGLDSDDLQERGSRFICCASGMYLPAQINLFPDSRQNCHAYRALVTLACASLNAGSFSTVHGEGGLTTCCDLFGDELNRRVACTLFYVTEISRTVQFARRVYPGVIPMLDRFIEREFEHKPPDGPVGRVLAALLYDDVEMAAVDSTMVDRALEIADASQDFRATRDLVVQSCGDISTDILNRYGHSIPRPLSFFPDFMFPLTVSEAPPDQCKADMHDVRDRPPEEDREEPEGAEEEDAGENAEQQSEGGATEHEEEGQTSGGVGYWYDEWNQSVNDYQRNWCRVVEKAPRGREKQVDLSDSALRYARKVQEVFERLKPEEVKVEKRLMEGDSIHMDHLIEYLSEGEERQGAEMRFYNKPLVERRDLAVSILLDVSGSTGEEADGAGADGSAMRSAKEFGAGEGERTVLQVEKEAAFVMGTGLDKLGDTFGLYGFTGNGRENCLFYRFKEFDEEWNDDTVKALLSVVPGSATRIGAALRHAGWKLAQCPEKTRLLLLITDGKPCDQEYDTESQYAQYDIRKACQENRRRDIHTFCVSTSENTPADMELMFPGGRYIILEDIRKLPRMLSRLYLRLTR
ncbi:MAG: nitric oxide reductase activation protein NorD [Planctomycetota bacterium]